MSYELRKALDKTIGEVFSANETFLASLLCNLELHWDEKIPTACTNGKFLKWNPEWFMELPIKTRTAVMLHELWHVARLHMIRRGQRDPKLWNIACVAKGTKIAMADGSERLVEAIESGDEIANINSGTSTVGIKINSGAKPIYEIVLESGRILRCSGDHKVLTDDGFRNADTLSEGDTCFVDTRYGQVLERELEPENYTTDC